MIAIILAAGFATRLYPLTRNFPKPLLEVGGRTVLDHLFQQLDALPQIERAVVVSNHRFLVFFQRWHAARPATGKLATLLDDGAVSNADRRGALGDLHFALAHVGINDDLLVCAADNLLRFSLRKLLDAYERRPAVWVCVHRVTDRHRLQRTGVAVLDAEHRVVEFAEKPRRPKSRWAVPPIYIYPRNLLPAIQKCLTAGDLPESLGSLLQWLSARTAVFAHRVHGTVLDIGNLQSLEAARKDF
jgi:glucose-1-phosphate thymidylyltransferase